MNVFKLFFSWNDRIGRKPYWAAIVPVELGIMVTAFLIGMSAPEMSVLGAVIFAYPRICVLTKRLHDLGRSGWLQVLPNILANILGRLAEPSHSPLLWVLSIVVEIGFLVVIGVLPGQPGRNTYGPSPGGPHPEDVF